MSSTECAQLLVRAPSACMQAWSSKGRVGMSKRAASGESIDPSSDSSSPGSPSPRLEQRHHSVKQSMPAHGSAYPSEVQLQQAFNPPHLVPAKPICVLPTNVQAGPGEICMVQRQRWY